MLKKNLIMSFVVVSVASGIAINFYESSTDVTQSKVSYKSEKLMSNAELSIPYVYRNNNYKNLLLLSDEIETKNSTIVLNDEKGVSGDIENNVNDTNVKEQENVVSKSKNQNDGTNINKSTNKISKSESSNIKKNKQESTISKPDKSSNSVNTNKPTNTVSKSENSNSNISADKQVSDISVSESEIPTIHYDRTTSIYENDNETLIRVEYYLNNKLAYYSSVEQFDVATKSYVEKIYNYNYETNTQVLVRTDIYSNGKLIKSY